MIVVPLVPPAVQTVGVDVVNVTGRPDDAVALTVTGVWAIVLLVRTPKVIVWLALLTLKLRADRWGRVVGGVAGLVCLIVQVPSDEQVDARAADRADRQRSSN